MVRTVQRLVVLVAFGLITTLGVIIGSGSVDHATTDSCSSYCVGLCDYLFFPEFATPSYYQCIDYCMASYDGGC
jgi:hypothetical protein